MFGFINDSIDLYEGLIIYTNIIYTTVKVFIYFMSHELRVKIITWLKHFIYIFFKIPFSMSLGSGDWWNQTTKRTAEIVALLYRKHNGEVYE